METSSITIPLTKNEELCKYYYEHGLSLDALLKDDSHFSGAADFDVEAFKGDTLTEFAREVRFYNEDKIIPEGTDISILLHPRYMPTRPHSHEYIEFAYLLEGECEQIIKGDVHTMKQGDLFLLAPGTEHFDKAYADDILLIYIMAKKKTFGRAFLSLLGHNDILSSFFSQIIFNNKTDSYLAFRTAGDSSIKNLVLQMYKDSKNPDDYSARLLNIQFEWLCLHLLRNHVSHIKILEGKTNSIVVELISYIKENFKTVDLDDVCDRFCYSKGHIQRVLKKSTGQTFNEILTKTKIEQACLLLKNNSISVHDIAGAVGFNDGSHFHRMFKKYMGMTPAEYRKTLGNSVANNDTV